MANIPNSVETLPKISITWLGCTNVTDRRQTTHRRQMDWRQHIANVKCEFTFSKNDNKIVQYKPTRFDKSHGCHAEIRQISHAQMQCHWKQQPQKYYSNYNYYCKLAMHDIISRIVVYVHLKHFNAKAKDFTCQSDGNRNVKNSLHITNQPANGLYNSANSRAI